MIVTARHPSAGFAAALEALEALELEGAPPVDAPPIILEALALPYGVQVVANGWGDRITFEAGSIVVPGGEPSRVKLLLDHRPKPFGFGVSFDERDGALWATMAIPRAELVDPEVANAVRQMANGVRDAVSVGVDLVDITETADRSSGALTVTVQRAELLELSSAVIPRFSDARIARIAASQTSNREALMPTTATGLARFSDVPPDDPPDDPPDELDAEVRRLVNHHAALLAHPAATAVPYGLVGGPLARFGSLAEYARARYLDPDNVPTLTAALVDQISPNNPGVIPPAWVAQVRGIIDLGRPLLGALGTYDPGADGLDVDWPYFDGDLYALVGKQTAEKTEITSVRVDLKRGTGHLDTYAGGSDIALQLIQRSRPSYLDAYLRIMANAYGIVTDKAAGTALLALTGAQSLPDQDLESANGVAAAIFVASTMVQTATGSPATVVALSTDLFVAIGPLVLALMAPGSNTAGASASAASLNVNLAGLTLTHVPHFPPGTMVVTNRAAAGWAEDGPQTISALDVARLGNSVAVWGLGTLTAWIPAGVVKVTAAPPVGGARKR